MPQLFPSILPGADHSHDPLRGDGDDDSDGDEESESESEPRNVSVEE